MISSVGRRRTFSDLRTEGRRVRSGVVRMSHLSPPSCTDTGKPETGKRESTAQPEVAFAIGRSFGNAVERNRGRRRLRAAFVEAWSECPEQRRSRLNGAFMLTGNRVILSASFERLIRDIDGCFDSLDSQFARNDYGD